MVANIDFVGKCLFLVKRQGQKTIGSDKSRKTFTSYSWKQKPYTNIFNGE